MFFKVKLIFIVNIRKEGKVTQVELGGNLEAGEN